MSDLIKLAKNLHKDSTNAERMLWAKLRAHRFHGMKLRRQQPVGRYIVDFICFEKNLVIDLDGDQHAEQREADRQREGLPRSEGLSDIADLE